MYRPRLDMEDVELWYELMVLHKCMQRGNSTKLCSSTNLHHQTNVCTHPDKIIQCSDILSHITRSSTANCRSVAFTGKWFCDLDLCIYDHQNLISLWPKSGKYFCELWFKFIQQFMSRGVHKISVAVALWPWPMTPWPWNLTSSWPEWEVFVSVLDLEERVTARSFVKVCPCIP